MLGAMRVLPLLLVALCLLPGCEPTTQDDGTIGIAVSVEPQAWLVERIGGDQFRVETLVPPGASPATYQVTDKQISRVMGCRTYIRIGVPFESGPWFSALAESDSLAVHDARDSVRTRELEGHTCAHGHDHHHHDHRDPHIWTSPATLAEMALATQAILDELDPDETRIAERAVRLTALHDELTALDGELREVLAPLDGSAFIVFHPAWGYFADSYGLRQVAIEVDGKAPSDAELTEVTELARDESIDVILVQPQFEGTSARAVADAIGGRVVEVDPLDVPGSLRELASVLTDGQAGPTRP